MNNAELIITLTLIKGLGRKTINKIIRQGVLNSLETIETIDYLNNINLKIKGIITKDELKYANEVAKRTIEICDREDIKISTLLDEDFPQKLKNIDDNPVIIYSKGDYNNLNDIFSLYSSYLNSMRTAIIYERSSSDYKKNKTVIDKNYDNAYKKYNNVLESIQQFLSLLENS